MNSETPNEPRQILIAEDSITQALLLEGILTRAGFRVTVANNGRKALEMLANVHPVAVITDIQMPEMDGYELCRRIKASPTLAPIPVILLTSLSAPQDIIRGLECGADNFIVKPYEESFLLSRLQTVLTNRELAKTSGENGLEIQFAGDRYLITSDRRQILNLLLSTYETAVNTNHSLREAQEALKAAQEQLIEAEKLQSVGRLAAGVAHEVKNPLAIMEMGIAFLATQQNSPNSALILGELEQAVKRADDVISSLMKLSTPEEMGMQAVEMDALLDRALSALETEISAAGIKVITHYAADAPQCRVDVAKIEQAFHNVLANAIQAMPQGGTLTLETSPRMLSAGDVGYDAGDRTGVRFREGEKALVVEVRDTGPGIPPESVGKVFEPFFTTKPTGKGMGLGLTVAKKLIDLHAGRITIGNVDAGGVGVTMMFKTI